MDVAGELTSVLSLKQDICLRVCLTYKHNKAAKTYSDIYKLQQINRFATCLVQLIYKIQCFTTQFLSLESEVVHRVSREKKRGV
jgi:hypothetical protein